MGDGSQGSTEALAREIDGRLECLTESKTETIRALRREYSARLRAAEPRRIYELADRLLEYPGFAHHFVAFELLHFHRPALRQLDRAGLERLGRRLDSWYAVDTFATLLAGPAWREGQIGDEVIEAWAASADRWWRRTALVSTVALNTRARGGRGDVPRTLRICRLLMLDRDDMVVKAMSWALRALTPHDPQAVTRFVDENEAALAGRVKREVRHKVETGLKNPHRKAG
jgi:3-methyladenine DNA glycosylase AlkD